jgi:hypothetical protein
MIAESCALSATIIVHDAEGPCMSLVIATGTIER